ncbi:hypothetical protein TRIUR3_01907 [Triticum urartu]|uniref:Uncharacterized protein n=1 Tax=Triticum urartu TaxID=4572 RepID=M7Z2T8_TRIUA|nr:hypothetical protein TRIUR3_01907 [Triticum urartu]
MEAEAEGNPFAATASVSLTPVLTSDASSTRRLCLKNGIQTNLDDDHVFQFASWSKMTHIRILTRPRFAIRDEDPPDRESYSPLFELGATMQALT